MRPEQHPKTFSHWQSVLAIDVDVVIAVYKKPFIWAFKLCDALPCRCLFIYDKGNKKATTAAGLPSNATRKSPFRVQVEQLPNIGRESHSFLHHIVNYYTSLPDLTFFSQAGLSEEYKKLKPSLPSPEHIALRLIMKAYAEKWAGMLEHCSRYLSEWSGGRQMINETLGQWWKAKFATSSVPQCTSWRGIFAAHKSRIRQHELGMYMDLLNDSRLRSSFPALGHYYERMWYPLFASKWDLK